MPLSEPRYILNWRNGFVSDHVLADRPVDWPSVFNTAQPLDLEIGIGNGSFLTPFAEAHPHRNIVGMEIESLYLRKADRKLTRAGLTNGRLLLGDAKLLIWKLFADGAIGDVYINYPDPWFKKRHKKRRLINTETLKMFTVKMSGTLTIATDDPEYRDFVLQSVEEAGCLQSRFPNGHTETLAGYFETKYERKWKNLGKPVYYMQFSKIATPSIDIGEYVLTQNLRFSLSRILEKSNRTLEVA